MNILAINASPHMDKANTALILNPFLEGIGQSGGTVDLLYTKRLRINPCLGDLNCALRTPGVCIQKDDMQMVLPKIRAADVLVLATPLYGFGMAGPLKNLIDRMLPLTEPIFELRDGHCRKKAWRGEVRCSKIVLVSNCGFWELDNFDPLVAHVKEFSMNMQATFVGALLRPHGPVLAGMMKSGGAVDVLDAAREAGRQLVTTGEIRPETLAVICRDLVPVDIYVRTVNSSFEASMGLSRNDRISRLGNSLLQASNASK